MRTMISRHSAFEPRAPEMISTSWQVEQMPSMKRRAVFSAAGSAAGGAKWEAR
jgi:hypothetical protein